MRVILPLLFTLICSVAHASNDLETKVNERLRALVDTAGFRGTALIAVDGKVVFRRGYGEAVIEHDAPNTGNTAFLIGSVSKQFAAAAILALEEGGALRVTDKVSDHVEDTPAAWAKMTIHHLLTHTSGIPNWFDPETNAFNYPSLEWTRPYTLPELVALYKAPALEFAPGSQFQYSNTGYTVLAHIVEQRSGMKYHEYLESRILSRVPMPKTFADHHQLIVPGRATGYVRVDGVTYRPPYYDSSIAAGAGELLSTVDDLLTWDRALHTDVVLSASSRQKMMTPNLEAYGYGLVIQKEFGRRIVWHNGWVSGFRADISRFVDDDVTIIVLTNQNDLEAHQVSMDLAELVFDEKLAPIVRMPAGLGRNHFPSIRR